MICFSKFFSLILLNTVLNNCVKGQVLCNTNDNDFYAAQIILFFAPMGESSAIRQQIAIYYHNPGFVPGDEIHVFSGEDEAIGLLNPLGALRPSEMKGTWMTNIVPDKLSYNVDTIYKTQCLGYFACWSRDGTSHTLRCLSTHPDWMGTRKSLFANQRLQDMFIPGTHNSGSYSEAEPQSYMQQLTVTQDHDVFQQLIAGARYIDLRPSIYNGKYWVNHGPLHPMNRMDDIVNDVIQFMNNTDEIVVLSFKEYPHGFETLESHLDFTIYLERVFADYLLPQQGAKWELTLGEIWQLDRRLILSKNYRVHPRFFWPLIVQHWANAQNLDDLRIHLMKSKMSSSYPVATMAELTLDHWTVLKNAPNHLVGSDTVSLRRLGAIVGPRITEWYDIEFQPSANIVAVDYIDSTGIVDVAIQWNERRLSSCYGYYRKLIPSVRNDSNSNETI